MRTVQLENIEWEVSQKRKAKFPTSYKTERPEPTNSVGELVDFAVQEVQQKYGAKFVNFKYSILD